MQDFKKLRVWQDSVEMTVLVYRATGFLPAAERYGLVSQMRSAAVSISSNLAEGSGRKGPEDTARFAQMAIGSACELESQPIVAHRLGLLRESGELIRRVDRLRRGMIRFRQRLEGL